MGESLFKWVNLAIGKGLSQNDFVTFTFHRRSVLIRQHRHDGHLLWWVWTQHKISIVPKHSWHLNNSGFNPQKTQFKCASCQNKYIFLSFYPTSQVSQAEQPEKIWTMWVLHYNLHPACNSHAKSHVFQKDHWPSQHVYLLYTMKVIDAPLSHVVLWYFDAVSPCVRYHS